MIINSSGEVGIGTTPLAGYGLTINGGIRLAGTIDAPTAPLYCGNVNASGELIVSGNKSAIKGGSPTLHLRHSTNRTAFLHNNGNIFYILSGAAGAADTADNWSQTANGRWPLEINLNNNDASFGGHIIANSGYVYGASYVYSSGFLQGAGSGGAFRFLRPDGWCRLQDGGGGHVDFAAQQLYAHSQITGNTIVSSNGLTVNAGGSTIWGNITSHGGIYGYFTTVSNTNTDYLCIQNNTAQNATTANWIRVAYGSFTAFHRCYTDDVLYNNESDESIDLFKNNYMGRVVIATGKIKTDYSRPKETEPEPEPEPEIDSMTGLPKDPIKHPKNKEDEWYSGIDKDGITIEDAVPVVALSRKKKDKRVFGVLGTPKRNTNNKERLIVNSIGEGAICVSNTNGNIENGDLLQSSDLLGYAEKQDDDLLHNYTIGKATIDCNFELDSPYYQCHEIENGIRVAFIACSYCCG
jgi:hypothetical protein